jgi:drug/metabolite transporter (DMT)-like permease
VLPLLALIGALSATSAAQVTYKKFSLGHGRGNLYAAIALFGMAPFLTYYAVKSFGIGLVFLSTSTTYVAVALMGRLLFAERITPRQVVAMVLILSGSLIYGLGAM